MAVVRATAASIATIVRIHRVPPVMSCLLRAERPGSPIDGAAEPGSHRRAHPVKRGTTAAPVVEGAAALIGVVVEARTAAAP